MAAQETTPETHAETDVARKIWLAGVGAYGRMFSEAQGQFEKIADTANDMFEQLVERGAKVEDTVRAQISANEPASKVLATVEKVTKQAADFRAERRAALEARVDTVRKTIGETLAPLNLIGLHNQIEELAAKVDALTAEVAALSGKKTVDAVATKVMPATTTAPSAPRAVKAAAKTEA